MYNEILNHKSILECESEPDQAQHRKDIEMLAHKTEVFAEFGAIVKYQSKDRAHKDATPRYDVCHPHECMTAIEACDLKNGADFVIEDGQLGVACYGQNYTFRDGPLFHGKKVYHMVETLCTFKFFRSGLDFDAINDMGQKELGKVYENELNFLDTKEFLDKLRGLKRRDLDEIIKDAEETLANRKAQQQKGKKKVKEH